MYKRFADWIRPLAERGAVPGGTLTIFVAGVVGVAAGFGAAFFGLLLETITDCTYGFAAAARDDASGGMAWLWTAAIIVSPPLGLLLVAWATRRFAPEAQGHGVPEVITAVARHDGVIRPRIAIVKILVSGITIGCGGSVGREGPIVQIGSAFGSSAGQWLRLSAKNIKVLVAAGAAAGISATFNAPLAGVVFASEIILGSFAVESLTPIVLASVLADVVQQHVGEHRLNPAFKDLEYQFAGAWVQLPSYLLLGLVAGLAAAGFIKVLYGLEDLSQRWLPDWRKRALVLGGIVGLIGAVYPALPPFTAEGATLQDLKRLPPLMGVGYQVVEHSLHLSIEGDDKGPYGDGETRGPTASFFQGLFQTAPDKAVRVPSDRLLSELLWLAPLVLLKPLMTSLTLAGGGSGGVFAPSLFLGATLGGSFGLVMNMIVPAYSHSPGVYAIVGMAAVVGGATQGVLSAILIVYEMTDQYEIILPIMAAVGVASIVTRIVDPESIYYKKLSRRGEHISRGHDLHNLDHVMVRDVMVRKFPTLNPGDNAAEIIKIARQHPEMESLPVMGADGKLIGIIRAEDLHRVLDSDLPPELVNAEDIALRAPLSVHPAENLIEAMRDFGARDVETLPVEVGVGESRRLVGLLLRSDVMRRYRKEMLSGH
ncbi:H(+)/Cl(-) exchange transporter ClcA [Botrimarina colliarenosi]|uniref:H(+)/Cl(-) exchange transporter ClcA n=1 Tax=Botrimarina colliarenosi TaxID=2528001 RepID=A0A5C6A1S9_9BACT|nr:chloride channel protein [Botrimarina colliarenosi]TWT93396.1 H(+)/Cl(-) exchange transporter ClcA [Botrimarina colliarenosi]